MSIILLGANGFLGEHLARHFSTVGQTLVGVDRDRPRLPELFQTWEQVTLPTETLAATLAKHQPTALLYAAGTAQVGASVEKPFMDFELSVRVWASVLEAVRLSGVACRVVFFSSAAVYGNPTQLPIAETAPLAPISPYGYHKVMCEQLAEYYARLYGVATCSLRIFSAYGEGLQRQVLWDVCRKALTQPTLELHGVGDETRDFIHARDIARAVDCVLAQGEFNGGVYNLASGQSVTIHAIAQSILRALDLSLPINFNGQQRPGDPLYWQADVSRLRALGFQTAVDFPVGVQAYAQWARQRLTAA